MFANSVESDQTAFKRSLVRLFTVSTFHTDLIMLVGYMQADLFYNIQLLQYCLLPYRLLTMDILYHPCLTAVYHVSFHLVLSQL